MYIHMLFFVIKKTYIYMFIYTSIYTTDFFQENYTYFAFKNLFS